MRSSSVSTIAVTAASLLLAGSLAGCSGSATAATDSPPASSSSAAVQGPVASSSVSRPDSPQRVDVATFATFVGQPGVTVVDVRTPAEFAEGHLAGAINMDVESPDFAAAVAGLDPEATYAVYCRTGHRSAIAVATMAEAGVVGTYDLEGGITAWAAAGEPIVT